jgi:uracil-DNA glycosylase
MTTEDILDLAPDEASVKASTGLAKPAKWLRLGAFDSETGETIWGEFQGSGKEPYRTVVEWDEETFRCTCPSRKRPCKHELALCMIRADDPSAFNAPVPEWADGDNAEAETSLALELPEGWEVLQQEIDKPYFSDLEKFVSKERANFTVFPPAGEEFNALKATPLPEVRVFILGQDPYHGPKQAHGLAFSVLPEVPLPPSLNNIYKELKADLDITPPKTGYLQKWAEQGVLMLNAVLTVRRGEANSHKGKGWETFTDAVIRAVSDQENPVVFVLWGNYAQKKEKLIDTSKHIVIKSAHPSPLSAHNGFFGSKPFSKINEALEEKGRGTIDWEL